MRKAIVTASILALLAIQPAMAQTNTTTAPVISDLTFSSVTTTSAVVSWTTDIAATSYVDFGTTNLYGNTLGNGTPIKTHSVTLLGLATGTLYHFRARSMEAVANYETKSTDLTFTTATAATNTNAVSNTNTTTSNINTNVNVNKNTNTVKNTNAALNSNANKNTNTAKNTNTNLNSNRNANTNSGVDLFNQNTNEKLILNVNQNTNTDLTNVNAETPAATGDGRAGIILIVVGVLLLVGIIAFAWWKARRPPVVRP